MPQKLMDVLRLGRCSHEFSWPRRADDGEYYQVCLLCAAEYKYDWKTMRRTERLDRTGSDATRARRRTHVQKPTWVPRARRLKFETPVRYRVKNLVGWYAGMTENLSQSGVLFQGAKGLPQNTLVEMRFEMPEEISGQRNSSVLCQGRIVRLKNKNAASNSEDSALLAAFILDYKFIH
ncbi:MAG TPA: PilZ domain-containing protein [Terriglobales bacterium]